jgi:hypothetical protein
MFSNPRKLISDLPNGFPSSEYKILYSQDIEIDMCDLELTENKINENVNSEMQDEKFIQIICQHDQCRQK